MQGIRQLIDIEDCVSRILEFCGSDVVLAAPLGLGKPNRLINAMYRRVGADPRRRLTIHTALSLDLPSPGSELERRFADPFLARHFGSDYPRLEYVAALRANRLPANVRVHEFYYQAGAMLSSSVAQRDYVSLNYTEVAGDLATRGVNVLVQLVARRRQGGQSRYSLGCNPDVTLDLLDRMAEAGATRPMVVAVVHEAMPFLAGDADVGSGEGLFDIVLDAPAETQTLFALPRNTVDGAEHAIGLHASTLVRDGGTLQIGIGALSDALVHALLLRQGRNVDYRALLGVLRGDRFDSQLVDRWGGLDPLVAGIYGSSEMVMDGFMHLRRAGILVRQVHDDIALQRALDSGAIGLQLRPGDAGVLRAAGVLPRQLDSDALARLIRFGILPAECRLADDRLQMPDGSTVSNDLDAGDVLAVVDRHVAGRSIIGGRYLQGGFCLGSAELYRWLATLQGHDHAGLEMCRISEVNLLQRGIEALAAEERRDARFFNSCMVATALGAAASDALEDGRVVSGVGGQYNFVALAHGLADARSILMLRATRRANGRLFSNIHWNYGHTTIPRHLRDIYVTEYGIADLRGRSDEDCVKAMLAISDARFQADLVREAIASRKLPSDFSIPDSWSSNTAEGLADRLRGARHSGLLPEYPFGSDFDAVEIRLIKALTWLRSKLDGPREWPALIGALLRPGECDPAAMQRMQFAAPRSLRERLMARLLTAALTRTRGRSD
jgi:acyl-CoA hydrolase